MSFMLSVIHKPFSAECRYAECRYAECRYAECRYVECRYAECRYAECHSAAYHTSAVSYDRKLFITSSQLIFDVQFQVVKVKKFQ
jgi:hypothetical protein